VNERTSISNTATWLNYYSDMPGGIDSAMFKSKTFQNQQTFTYRKVNAFRYRSTITQQWSESSKSTLSLIYRNNAIGQNPAYRIKDDYRKQGNSWTGKKALAHGEINQSSFSSYALLAQHRQNLRWKEAVVIGGINVDVSPSSYSAQYIKINKDSVSKKYTGYQQTDSTLTDYKTKLNNYAAFVNVEFSPVRKLRVVGSLRYDYFHYNFSNSLPPSSFSGSSDTINDFSRLSPKVGITYALSGKSGIYANYSQGFVPPQVTEMYTGVKVPNLRPSVFYNYEAGGWIEVVKNRLSADVSVYQLTGTNEIISVRQDNGSFANQNAGKTLHRGVELGINAKPLKNVAFRFSGAYSRHEFVEFVEKGARFNGNEMNNAPNWMYNTEVWYHPAFIRGFGIGAELQHIGSYFMDPQNTTKYNGYNVVNIRAQYKRQAYELWVNIMNVTNNYYSYISSKSAYGYSYQVAEPVNINVGISYDLAGLWK
jgi:iron complex outermembrane receptor protein